MNPNGTSQECSNCGQSILDFRF
ncbi:hypothetical protein QUB56_19360 [Microcoleus sp. AR_TQ3_B6]